MKTLKAAAASLSLFGFVAAGVAASCGLKATFNKDLPDAVACLGFAVLAGCSLLGGAILTAVQPFVPRTPNSP